MSKEVYIPKKRAIRKSVWLVTFGDLLTLLLCFFLSTVALPLRTNSLQPAVNTREFGDLNQVKDRAGVLSTAGTMLANNKRESLVGLKETPSREYEIREEFFSPGGSVLSEEGRQHLKSVPLSAGYRLESAEISSCTYEKGRGGKRGQRLSTERALSVRSQLIDTGVPSEKVRVRANFDCNENGLERRPSAEFVGTIRFSVRKSSNG